MIVARTFDLADASFALSLQQKALMLEYLTRLVTEKGLDSQNYHCAGCKRPIGISEPLA